MSFPATLRYFLFALTVGAPVFGAPLFVPSSVANAQQAGATVHGTVADPTGAVIPGATVTLTPATGKAIMGTTQGDGTYTLPNVPPGLYSETVTMPGFASFAKLNMRIAAGPALSADVKLAIQEQSQQVNVTAEGATISTDSDSNASSTILTGGALDALSDDPDDLSSELTALAGPAAGPNGGQIYVDGFTGGQLPPKSSIREIRINQNPFSAQYDKLGYGRVEIFTKPGTDKFHGNFQVQGNANFLNTSNPFLGNTPQLPYHTIFVLGSFTGPISHKASFSAGGSHRVIEQNTIFDGDLLAANATAAAAGTPCLPGATTGCSVFNLGIPVLYPQTRTDFSPRFDFQLTDSNTLSARYQIETSTATNDGTGGFDLPSTGYTLTQTENTLQLDDTQMVSSKIINETRFEYQRDLSAQNPNTTGPAYSVLSAFTFGGNSTQVEHDHQDHWEVQNYSSIQLAKNFIRFGGRFRSTTDSQYTDSGANGYFSYRDITDYENQTAEQYNVTNVVHGSTHGTLSDVGLYAEDDWKPKQNLTITYGIRYESQNYTSDHADIAPRLSFAWGVGSNKGNPQTVIRGGFGLFYERSSLTNVVNTLQDNGVNFQAMQVRNPAIGCTNVVTCNASATDSLQTYTFAPNFHAPRIAQSAIGFDEQLGKFGTLSINYQNAHGVHEFNESDQTLVADLAGAAAPTINGVIPAYAYQYQSEGVFNQNQLSISPRINYGRNISLSGYYVLNFAKSDTTGAGSLPTVPNDLRGDYGRANFDTRNRLFVFGSFTFPHLITASPFLVASSGAPYNIYTGTDLNGDGNLTNDRPYYATGATVNPIVTKYGTFDTNPATGGARVPINIGTGPALVSMNLRLSKTFGFGGEAAGNSDQGHGGPGGGGPPGGRGGDHRGGGPFGAMPTSRQRYNLSFGVYLNNLFNDVDLSPPNGNISSTLFGKSTQLAGGFMTTNSAVRRITLQTNFTF
jgi:Carboxypeptidase regulatory-like domain